MNIGRYVIFPGDKPDLIQTIPPRLTVIKVIIIIKPAAFVVYI